MALRTKITLTCEKESDFTPAVLRRIHIPSAMFDDKASGWVVSPGFLAAWENCAMVVKVAQTSSVTNKGGQKTIAGLPIVGTMSDENGRGFANLVYGDGSIIAEINVVAPSYVGAGANG